MHQTAKGKQWYFGMKMHVGVDSKGKLIHTILASPANTADALALAYLLHGDTSVGRQSRSRAERADANRGTGKRFDERIKAVNRIKSQVRAKVEHSIGIITRVFGFKKVRYRGLAKNLHRLEVCAALANLYMVRRRLLASCCSSVRSESPFMTHTSELS